METLIPANPFAAASSATPNLLHLMFFALTLGIAVTLVSAERVAPFLGMLEGLYDISAKVIDLIMKAAPFAVAAPVPPGQAPSGAPPPNQAVTSASRFFATPSSSSLNESANFSTPSRSRVSVTSS